MNNLLQMYREEKSGPFRWTTTGPDFGKKYVRSQQRESNIFLIPFELRHESHIWCFYNLIDHFASQENHSSS